MASSRGEHKMPRTVDGAPASARDAAPTPSTLLSKRAGPMRLDRIKTGFEKRQYSVGSNLLAGKVLPYLYCLFSKNSEKTEQVTVSDTRRLVSKNNNTTSLPPPRPVERHHASRRHSPLVRRGPSMVVDRTRPRPRRQHRSSEGAVDHLVPNTQFHFPSRLLESPRRC